MIPIVQHSLKYNPAIDGLRGVSISLVLLFHIWPNYFPFGYLGVDIFFLLSGYLITNIIYTKLETNSFSFKEFYRNRIRRIFPAMIIVLFSAYIIGYLFMFPQELEKLGRHIQSSAFFYQNFRLIGEAGYWDEASKFKPLLHFWSLSIEEQFYLVWPFIIFVIYKLRLNLIFSLAALTALMFSISFFIEMDSFYNSFARFWELCFGGLLFAIKLKYKSHKYSLDNKFLASSPLVFLGLISFPLYLWHYLFISYVHIFSLDVGIYGTVIIAISILFAYLTYRYVELYARKQTSYKFVFMLFMIVLSIGLFGKHIENQNGFPLRKHLVDNNIFEAQFKKVSSQDENGRYFVENILGYEPKYNYMKATNRFKADVLIIGDSHAYSSYDGLAVELKKQNLDTLLLANDSCPPYFGYAFGRNELESYNCSKTTKEFMQIIKEYKFKKIFLITRGPKYTTKEGFGSIDNEEEIKNFSFYKTGFIADEKLSYSQKFYKNIDLTFSYLNLFGIPIYYIFENPEMGFSPKSCMNRPFNIFPNECKIKYESYYNRMFKYKSEILKISKKYQNIHILDPQNAFCDFQYCYAIKDKKMLYADDDHLSIDGSSVQAKYLLDEAGKNKDLNVK